MLKDAAGFQHIYIRTGYTDLRKGIDGLKPYEYFVYLLYELMKYPRGKVPDEARDKMMSWSEEIPDECRKTKTR